MNKEPRKVISRIASDLVSSAKRRAKKRGRPFDGNYINHTKATEWVSWAFSYFGRCGCCGVKYKSLKEYGKGAGSFDNHSLTLDAFYPELGYVEGNCILLCFKCNSIKGSMSCEEAKQLYNWFMWARLRVNNKLKEVKRGKRNARRKK